MLPVNDISNGESGGEGLSLIEMEEFVKSHRGVKIAAAGGVLLSRPAGLRGRQKVVLSRRICETLCCGAYAAPGPPNAVAARPRQAFVVT
jgi:hypothetical protein